MGDRTKAENTHNWHEKILIHEGFEEPRHPTQIVSAPPKGIFHERTTVNGVVAGYHDGFNEVRYFLISNEGKRKIARICDRNGRPLDEISYYLGRHYKEVKANLRLLAASNDSRAIERKFVRLQQEEADA